MKRRVNSGVCFSAKMIRAICADINTEQCKENDSWQKKNVESYNRNCSSGNCFKLECVSSLQSQRREFSTVNNQVHISNANKECLQETSTENSSISRCLGDIDDNKSKISTTKSATQAPRKPKRVFIRRSTTNNINDSDSTLGVINTNNSNNTSNKYQANNTENKKFQEKEHQKEKRSATSAVNSNYEKSTETNKEKLSEFGDDYEYFISIEDSWRRSAYDNRSRRHNSGREGRHAMSHTSSNNSTSNSLFYSREREGSNNNAKRRSRPHEQPYLNKKKWFKNKRSMNERLGSFCEINQSTPHFRERQSRTRSFPLREEVVRVKVSGEDGESAGNVNSGSSKFGGIFSAACKQLPSPPNLQELMSTKYKDRSAREQNDIAVSILQSYFLTLRRTATMFKQNVIGIAAVVCGRIYLIELLSTMLTSNLNSSYRPAKYKHRMEETEELSTKTEALNNEENKISTYSSSSSSEEEQQQKLQCAMELYYKNKLQPSSTFKLKWNTTLAEEILISFSVLDGRTNYIYIAEEASAFLIQEHDKRQYEEQQQQQHIISEQNKSKIYKEVIVEKDGKTKDNNSCTEENTNQEQTRLLHLSNRLRRSAQLSFMVLKVLQTWGQSIIDISNLLMPYQERRRNIVADSVSYTYSPLVESSRWQWEKSLTGITPFTKSTLSETDIASQEINVSKQREIASNNINSEDENNDYERYDITVNFPVNLERYLTEVVVPSLMTDLNEFCEIIANQESKLDSHIVNSDDLSKNFNTLRQEYPHAFLSAVEVEAFSSAINVCTKLLTRRLFYTEDVKCTDGSHTRYLHVHPPHWAHSLRTRTPTVDEKNNNYEFATSTRSNDKYSDENDDNASVKEQRNGVKLALRNCHRTNLAASNDKCENNQSDIGRSEENDQSTNKFLCKEKAPTTNNNVDSTHAISDQCNDTIIKNNNTKSENRNVKGDTCKGRIQPICLKSFVLTLRKFTRSVFALSESCAWKFDAPLTKNDAELWSQEDNENVVDNENDNHGNASSTKMKYGKVAFNFDSISPAILFMLNSSSFALLLDNHIVNEDELAQLANETTVEKEEYIKQTARKMERSLTQNVEIMMKIMLYWMSITRTFQIATISTLYAKLIAETNVAAKNASDRSLSNPLRWPSTESSWNETIHGKTYINEEEEEEQYEQEQEERSDEVDSHTENKVYSVAQMQENILNKIRRSEFNNQQLETTTGSLSNGISACSTIHELFTFNMFASLSHVSLQRDQVLMNICASANASYSRFSPSDSAALFSSMMKIFHTIKGKTKLSDLIVSDNFINNSCNLETMAATTTTTTITTTTNINCGHSVNEPSLDRIVELQRRITGTLTRIMLGWVSLQIKRIRFINWRMFECQYIHVTHPYARKLARMHNANAITSADSTPFKSLINANNQMTDLTDNAWSPELGLYPDRKEYLTNETNFPHGINVTEYGKDKSSSNEDIVADMRSSSSSTSNNECKQEESKAKESFTHDLDNKESSSKNNGNLETMELIYQQELRRSIGREWDAKVFLVCIVPWYYYMPWGVHRFVSTATFTPMEALTQFKASLVLNAHPVPSEQRESLMFFAHSYVLYETLEARQLYDVLNSYFHIAYKENIKEIFESNCVFLLARHDMKRFTQNELAKLIRILELAGLYSVMRFCNKDKKHDMTTDKTLMSSEDNKKKQVTHTTNSHIDNNNKSNSYDDELPKFATCEEIVELILKLSKMTVETDNDIHIYSTPFIYYSKKWYLDSFSTHQSLSLFAHYLSACTYPTPSLELRIFVLSIAVRVANEFITTVSRVRAHRSSTFVDYVNSTILPFYILCSIYLAEDERQCNIHQSRHSYHQRYHSNVQSALQEKISHALRGIHRAFEKMLLHVDLNNNYSNKDIYNGDNNFTFASKQNKKAKTETQIHNHNRGIDDNSTNIKTNAGDVIELAFKSCALLSQCNCVQLPSQCITLIRNWASNMLGEASPLHFIHLLSLFTDRMYFNQNTSSYNSVLSLTETSRDELMSTAQNDVCNVYSNLFPASPKELQEKEEEQSEQQESVRRIWRQAVQPYIKATYNLYKGKGLLAWTLLPYMFGASGKSTHFCNQPLECMSMVLFALDSLCENDFFTIESVLWLTKQIYCIDWMLLSSLPTEYAIDLYDALPSSECKNVDHYKECYEHVVDSKTAPITCNKKDEETIWQRRRITKEVQEKVRRVIYNNLEYFMHIKSDSIQPMLELLALLCKAETNATRLALHYCNYYTRSYSKDDKNNTHIQTNDTKWNKNYSCRYNNDCLLFAQEQYSSLLEDCVNYITQNEAHLEMAFWKSSDTVGRFKLIQPQVMCYIMEALKWLPTHEPLFTDKNNKPNFANSQYTRIDGDNGLQAEWRQFAKHANDNHECKVEQELTLKVYKSESEEEVEEHERQEKQQQEQQQYNRIVITLSKDLLRRNSNVKTKMVNFITPLIDISSFVMCKHFTTFSQYLPPFIELISEICPHLLHEFLSVALGVSQLQNKEQNKTTDREAKLEQENERLNNIANEGKTESSPFRVSAPPSTNTNSDYLESSMNEYENQQQRTPRENRWLKQRRELLSKVYMNPWDMNTGAEGVNKLLRAVIFLSNLSNAAAASSSKHTAPAKLASPSSKYLANGVTDAMSSDETDVYDDKHEKEVETERGHADVNSTNAYNKESNLESDILQLQRERKGEVERKLPSLYSERKLTFTPHSENTINRKNDINSNSNNSSDDITSFKKSFFNCKSESEECLENAIRIIMELIEGYMTNLTYGAFSNIDLKLVIQVMKLFERKKTPAHSINWIIFEIILFVNNLCLTAYSNYARHVHDILRQCEHVNNENVDYHNLHAEKKPITYKLAEQMKLNNVNNRFEVELSDGVLMESNNTQKESSSQEMQNSSIAFGKFFCYSRPTWWRKLFHEYNCENHPLIYYPSSESAAKRTQKASGATILNSPHTIKNEIRDCEVDWEIASNIPLLPIDESAIKSKEECVAVSNGINIHLNNNNYSKHKSINDVQLHPHEEENREELQYERPSSLSSSTSSSSPSLSPHQQTQYAELSEFFSKLPVEMTSFNLAVWIEIVEYHNKLSTRTTRSSSDRLNIKDLFSSHNKTVDKQTAHNANEGTNNLRLKEEGQGAISNEGLTCVETNANRNTATENVLRGKYSTEINETLDSANVLSLLAFVKTVHLRSFYVFTALSATQVEHIQQILGPLHFLHLTKEIVNTYLFNMSEEQRGVLNKLWRAHSNVWKEALKWKYGQFARLTNSDVVVNPKERCTHNVNCTKTPVTASVTTSLPWWQKEPSERNYPWILPSSPITSTVLGDEFIYCWIMLAWETLGKLATSPETFMSVIVEQAHANIREQEEQSTSHHKRKRLKKKPRSSLPEELFEEEQEEYEELEELEEEEEEYDDISKGTTTAMNKTWKSGESINENSIGNDTTAHNDDDENGNNSFMRFDTINKIIGYDANGLEQNAVASVVIDMQVITEFLSQVECSQLALRERQINCFIQECFYKCEHNKSESQKAKPLVEMSRNNNKGEGKQHRQRLPLLVCGKCEGAPVQILKCITQNMITCKKERELHSLEVPSDGHPQKRNLLCGKIDWNVENYTSVLDYRKWCPLECTSQDVYSGHLNKEAIVTDNILTPMSKLSVRTRYSTSNNNSTQNVLENQNLQFNRMAQLGFDFSSTQSKNDQVVEHALQEITNNWLREEQRELDNLLKDSIITVDSSNLSKSEKEQRDEAHAVEPMLRKSIASLMPSDIIRLLKILIRQGECYVPLSFQLPKTRNIHESQQSEQVEKSNSKLQQYDSEESELSNTARVTNKVYHDALTREQRACLSPKHLQEEQLEHEKVNTADLDVKAITPSVLLAQQAPLTPILTVQLISFFDAFTDLINIATPTEIISIVNIAMSLLVNEIYKNETVTQQQQHSDANTREECVKQETIDQKQEHEMYYVDEKYQSNHSLLHSLRRLLSTIPLVIANDVERFTEREIAYLLIVLHQPEISAYTLTMERLSERLSVTERFVKFAEVSESHALPNSLFAHSLLSVQAIRAVENYFFASQSEETLEEYLKYEEVVKSALRDGSIVKIWSRIQRNIANNFVTKSSLSNELMSKLLIFIETTTHHELNKQSIK